MHQSVEDWIDNWVQTFSESMGVFTPTLERFSNVENPNSEILIRHSSYILKICSDCAISRQLTQNVIHEFNRLPNVDERIELIKPIFRVMAQTSFLFDRPPLLDSDFFNENVNNSAGLLKVYLPGSSNIHLCHYTIPRGKSGSLTIRQCLDKHMPEITDKILPRMVEEGLSKTTKKLNVSDLAARIEKEIVIKNKYPYEINKESIRKLIYRDHKHFLHPLRRFYDLSVSLHKVKHKLDGN